MWAGGEKFGLTASRARALPSWLRGYLANLERRLRDMPTDVMLRSLGSGQGPQRLETRKLYVPLHVPSEHPGGAAQDPASTEERKPVPLLTALAETRRLVVQGPPGCGKSTFLRYLALRLAGRLVGEPLQPADEEETMPEALDGVLPLFVELKPFYERHLQPNLRSDEHPPAPDEIDSALSDYLRATYRELREPEHREALLTSDPPSPRPFGSWTGWTRSIWTGRRDTALSRAWRIGAATCRSRRASASPPAPMPTPAHPSPASTAAMWRRCSRNRSMPLLAAFSPATVASSGLTPAMPR